MMSRALAVAILLSSSATTSSAPAAPANDAFHAATDIGPAPSVSVVSPNGGTLEQDEPVWCLRAHDLDASVWFRYTPSETERISIRATQTTSSFGHLLSIYTGERVDALRPVTCADTDSFTRGASVDLLAQTGTAYMIQVAAGANASGTLRLAVAPSASGEITGTVTATDGTAVEQICVRASSLTSRFIGTTETGPHGRYTLSASAGSYVVHFTDCRRRGYTSATSGGDEFSVVGTVIVRPHERTDDVNATLRRFGSIAGRVTISDGTPASSVCVYRLSSEGSLGDRPATTKADGRFVLEDVLPGDYRIKFIDCRDEARYVSEWYEDQPTWHTASAVSVAEGAAVAGIDATLALVSR